MSHALIFQIKLIAHSHMFMHTCEDLLAVPMHVYYDTQGCVLFASNQAIDMFEGRLWSQNASFTLSSR